MNILSFILNVKKNKQRDLTLCCFLVCLWGSEDPWFKKGKKQEKFTEQMMEGAGNFWEELGVISTPLTYRLYSGKSNRYSRDTCIHNTDLRRFESRNLRHLPDVS